MSTQRFLSQNLCSLDAGRDPHLVDGDAIGERYIKLGEHGIQIGFVQIFKVIIVKGNGKMKGRFKRNLLFSLEQGEKPHIGIAFLLTPV